MSTFLTPESLFDGPSSAPLEVIHAGKVAPRPLPLPAMDMKAFVCKVVFRYKFSTKLPTLELSQAVDRTKQIKIGKPECNS